MAEKVTEQETFEKRLDAIDDDANVVIMECAELSDVTFDDLKSSCVEYCACHSYTAIREKSEDKFLPLSKIRLEADSENEAVYVVVPGYIEPDTVAQGMHDEYGNAFTYITTDGHSAKNFDLEELDGGIAGRDLTLVKPDVDTVELG